MHSVLHRELTSNEGLGRRRKHLNEKIPLWYQSKMKRISLILAVMFLVFDYSWAGKEDADKSILNGNHANSFLVHKRDWCSYVQSNAEYSFEMKYSQSGSTVDVHEECCVEECSADEMYWNLYGLVDYGDVRTDNN
ncbi:hypothetical protein ACROYT_G025223 [Oculina patagonica]